MRIALVAIHPHPSPQAIPLANAFLQSYLSVLPATPAVEISLHDFFIGQDISDCARGLVAQRFDAIGFSMYVWNREMCREIAEQLVIRQPGLRLFAGGPEATADPAGVMANAPFDFGILGEGEIPFAAVCCRLAEGRELAGIPGIALRSPDSNLTIVPGPALADLDAVPSPWLNGTLDSSRFGGILWQLSRGCAFTCDFCYDSRGVHGVRRFSLERIEAELRHFAATGVSQVFVLDSTFNQDQERAKIILRMIGRIAPRIHFHFEARSEFIDSEMAHLFAKTSCSLQIGLQSADPQVMKGVGRGFNPKQFVAKANLLNRSGAVFGFDLIYGLPGDSPAGFAASIDFALRLYPNHLDIFPLAILPGTALASRADAIGLSHLPAPPYTLVSSPTFSAAEMVQARRLASACDIFYTRGKAVAWFNSVVASLRMHPSQLLAVFGEWLANARGAEISEGDLDDEEIWQLQRSFLTTAYGTGKQRRLLPLALDLVDYHHHYAAALLAPAVHFPGKQSFNRRRLIELPARLAPTTRLARFHYEILDILEAGELDLATFSNHCTPTGSWAAIYRRNEGIFTESLIEPLYRLLEQLDGKTPCGEIAARLGIAAEDALPFLEFAMSEKLIMPPA